MNFLNNGVNKTFQELNIPFFTIQLLIVWVITWDRAIVNSIKRQFECNKVSQPFFD